jgi:hypothetical protein
LPANHSGTNTSGSNFGGATNIHERRRAALRGGTLSTMAGIGREPAQAQMAPGAQAQVQMISIEPVDTGLHKPPLRTQWENEQLHSALVRQIWKCALPPERGGIPGSSEYCERLPRQHRLSKCLSV